MVAHRASHQAEGPQVGDTHDSALRGDARLAHRCDDAGMKHAPRLDVLQAAIVAVAAALHPDQASVARAVLLAGVADLEDRPGCAADDAAAAAALDAVLEVLVRIGD